MTREWWLTWFTENKDWFVENYQRGYAVARKLSTEMKDKWDTNTIHTASGATKYCIIDTECGLVFKWSLNLHYNEMKQEYFIYTKAVEQKIECFFPKTEIFIDLNDIVIYAQEKIDTLYCDVNYRTMSQWLSKHKTVKDAIIKKASRAFQNAPSCDWIQMAISYYGKRKVRALCAFTREYKINDLHGANVGFHGANNMPIILDFSGYNRNSSSSFSS